MSGQLTSILIHHRHDLVPLRAEWNGLLARSRADGIFATWEWVSTWLDVVHPTAQLFVVTLRDSGGRLVGVVPLYLSRLRLGGVVGLRCLRVLGDRHSGAEYPDIIASVDCEEEVVVAAAGALAAAEADWDCLWVPYAATWTGAVSRWKRLCEHGGWHLRTQPREFAAVALPETVEAYWAMLPKKRRANVRRAVRQLRERCDVQVGRCTEPCEVMPMLERLFRLHEARWRHAGQPGSFSRKPAMARFYERFAPHALSAGWLYASTLTVDGSVCAVQYGYAYAGVLLQLQEGFNPQADFDAGNILRALTIEEAIGARISEYDFLAGYTGHKRLWRAELRMGCDLLAARRSLKGSLLFLKDVWPSGRLLQEVDPPDLGVRGDSGDPRPSAVSGEFTAWGARASKVAMGDCSWRAPRAG